MIQRREQFCFALETCESIRITGKQLRQDLDRDVTLETCVPRPVDLAHTALPEFGEDLVRAEPQAWWQRHCSVGADYRRVRADLHPQSCIRKRSNRPVDAAGGMPLASP